MSSPTLTRQPSSNTSSSVSLSIRPTSVEVQLSGPNPNELKDSEAGNAGCNGLSNGRLDKAPCWQPDCSGTMGMENTRKHGLHAAMNEEADEGPEGEGGTKLDCSSPPNVSRAIFPQQASTHSAIDDVDRETIKRSNRMPLREGQMDLSYTDEINSMALNNQERPIQSIMDKAVMAADKITTHTPVSYLYGTFVNGYAYTLLM